MRAPATRHPPPAGGCTRGSCSLFFDITAPTRSQMINLQNPESFVVRCSLVLSDAKRACERALQPSARTDRELGNRPHAGREACHGRRA